LLLLLRLGFLLGLGGGPFRPDLRKLRLQRRLLVLVVIVVVVVEVRVFVVLNFNIILQLRH
jgi:hypothetical protein